MYRVCMRFTPKAESQTDQTPFTCSRCQAACLRRQAQGELSKAEDLLDDADHGFDGALAQTINRSSDFGLEFIGHLDHRTGVLRRWFRLFLKAGVPIQVMRFTSGGNVRVDLTLFNGLDVSFAEVAIIQSRSPWLPELRREGIQSGNSFLIVIGMVRKGPRP